MKKLGIVLILALILATGTAFAQHPKGFGIGLVAGYHGVWDGAGYAQYGLSLKVPSIPIFWTVNLHLDSGYFSLNLSGDKYIIDQSLVKDIHLGWYLGIGGWGSIASGNDLALAGGVRLPIGLSFQPIDMLEIFLDIAPSLGIRILPGVHFPEGGWPVELGLRVWF